MPVGPKPDSPDFYWLDCVKELQAMVAETDPRYLEYWALLQGNTDQRCLDVSDFCNTLPSSYHDPTMADFLSGDWLQELINAATGHAFNFLSTQEYLSDVMDQMTTTITAEELKSGPLSIPIVPAPTDGSVVIPCLIVARFIFGTIPYNPGGDFSVTLGDSPNLIALIQTGVITMSASNLDIEPVGSLPKNDLPSNTAVMMSNTQGFTDGDGYLIIDAFFVRVGP